MDAAIGATEIGATLYELSPRSGGPPYHWHVVEEEWLLVVSGGPTIRMPDGERTLREGDVVVFPTGPVGAHSMRNDSEETARVLMFANLMDIEACVYPDSGKIGVWTPHEGVKLMNRPESNLDYWHGEER